LPDGRFLTLSHAVFDWNGTLALDGHLSRRVEELLRELAQRLKVYIVSADTHGTLQQATGQLGLDIRRVKRGEEKVAVVHQLRAQGARGVVAVGNGANDVGMLRAADCAIAVVGGEGAVPAVLWVADVVCPSGEAAIQLLLHPQRLVATLRP
jgi:P-type E1-E2 ATPase